MDLDEFDHIVASMLNANSGMNCQPLGEPKLVAYTESIVRVSARGRSCVQLIVFSSDAPVIFGHGGLLEAQTAIFLRDKTNPLVHRVER